MQIYYFYEGVNLNYIEYKDVMKICSFFYKNYGTIIFTSSKNDFTLYALKKINCPQNATNLHSCKLKGRM